MKASFFFLLASGVLPVPLLAGCNSQTPATDNGVSNTAAPIVLAPKTMPQNAVPVAPSTHAKWPWPNVKQDAPHLGVTHWLAYQNDGTMLDLLRFDFKANPDLRFEIYSQDEDDSKPFDNAVKYWPMGVGQATRRLNSKFEKSKSGPVVAAWNGAFFGYNRKVAANGEIAFHLAPLVLRGRVLFNTGNHRWTFGVKTENGKQKFKSFHLPGRKLLEREFDFASGTVQNLLHFGKPLKMRPFPKPGEEFARAPVASTPDEAGHIPYFDHAKFSRASIGWSKDSGQLFLLLVRESNSDGEGESIRSFMHGKAQSDGWSVPDVQQFWLALQKRGWVHHAINSDAGGVAQMVYRLPSRKYLMIPPQGAYPEYSRREFAPDFPKAPAGGPLMFFYVRDLKIKK